jgi:acetylornithine/succinyldiaminopimelate/putrescine aminotransferase
MSWMGQTNGVWNAEAEADADADVAAVVHQQNASIRELKADVQKLQKSLDKMRTVLVDKSGAEAAQTALKFQALAEIQRLDPSNKLLDSNYRQKIYDEVKSKTEKDMQKK